MPEILKRKKVAILYICTGKYSIFWKDFFESAEKLFLNNLYKHYFVFTDDESLKKEYQNNNNISFIYQKQIGWPYDTLKRFHMFSMILNDLEMFDYIFFINANTIIMQEIGEEILPDHNEEIVACLHPGYFNITKNKFPYEKNKKSKAYIDKKLGSHYYAGGFNGGTNISYIKLITTLRKYIDEDLTKNIIAIWHDESYINKYLVDYGFIKIIDPGYLYPEGWDLPFEKKIVVKNKENYGGHNLLRNISNKKTKYYTYNILWEFLRRLLRQ
jgi:hypothetical protein